jgi:hypothetical protein
VGSLRNPIGPLPAAIYWRRRAGAVCILVLLALLAYWAVSLTSGGGGDGGSAGKRGGGGPAASITPGPSASRSLPDDRPGGRDEVNGGGSGTGGGSGGGSGSGAGAGGATGDGGSSGGSGTGGGSSLTGGDGVPAGSGIPGCTARHVTASLHSKQNTYAPDDRPVLTLTLHNDSGADCVVDLGDKGTVVTVTDSGDETVYASDDCPEGAAHDWVRVSAHDSSTHTITWDRHRSSKGCATPSPQRAPAGTYLAEVSVGGLHKARTSFVLAKS